MQVRRESAIMAYRSSANHSIMYLSFIEPPFRQSHYSCRENIFKKKKNAYTTNRIRPDMSIAYPSCSAYLTTSQFPSRFEPILSMIFFSCNDLKALSIVRLLTPICLASSTAVKLGSPINCPITPFSVFFKPTFKPTFTDNNPRKYTPKKDPRT